MTARPNVEYGNREVALSNEILRTTVGSQVHGIAIAGTDDHDEMGVFIEPPEYVLGMRAWDYVNNCETVASASNQAGMPHLISRTQPEGVRSGPGDTDLVCYSLRKYLRLAVKGNPTALLPLFAPTSDVLIYHTLGYELRRNRDWFLSREAVERFLGYMQSQHERMMGRGKQNRVPARPELIEQYGWDVKYGSHALRLAYQGYEIAVEGTLTLPLKRPVRERVLAVKRGEVSRIEVSHEITDMEVFLTRALERGDRLAVPDKPNIAAITEWSIDAHRRHWGWS